MSVRSRESVALRSKILELIEQNYVFEAFDVPKLAKLAETSERTLARKCNAFFDSTPHKLIEKKRLGKAKQLLLAGYKPDQIWNQVGYKAEGTFRKAFINATKQTPRAFIDSSAVEIKQSKADKLNQSLREIINQNIDSPDFCASKLADLSGFSEKTLLRRCKALLDVSPSQLIQRVKIENIKAIFNKDMNDEQVARMVGYRTVRAMQNAFESETGLKFRTYKKDALKSDDERIAEKIHALIGRKIDLDSDDQIKKALRDDLSIRLPQRNNLINSLASAISDHEILNLLIKYRKLTKAA